MMLGLGARAIHILGKHSTQGNSQLTLERLSVFNRCQLFMPNSAGSSGQGYRLMYSVDTSFLRHTAESEKE